MQGQPAQEAPAPELHELLKEIKELKAGLLVDSVTHDNPTFEGPPWANQQAGMRLDITTDDLEDSLEDLVARDTGLQYILSPQAEAQVAQSSRNTESERCSPRRAGPAASGIGRGRNAGLQTTVAVSGTPGTPAGSLPGRHGVAPPVPAAAGSAHRTPLASRGATSAFLSGPTSAATPVASADPSAVAVTPAATAPTLTTPVSTTMRSKIGSRIARAGAAVAAGNTAGSRTPVGIPSPTLRSTVQLNAQSPSPATGALTHPVAMTGALPAHGTTVGAAASVASPRAPPQTSTPAPPRTTRQKVAGAVGALGTTGGRYSPRSIGKSGPPTGPSPASSTLGARSSTGSGGSSSTGSTAPATTTQTPGPSVRKRPPQGGTTAPSSTPARKVPGSAGLPGGTAARSVTSGTPGTQSRTTATPSALGTAGKIPARSVNSATASVHSGSAASSPPPSPQRKRTAVAAASTSTGAAAKRPQHSNLPPSASAVAAGTNVSAAAISTDELECETSHRSLTLPTAAIGPDVMAEESLEDLLADDPWLAASTQADASCGTGVFDVPGDLTPRLQRRTSDELLRPLADAMAEGTGNSDWMDEDTDAAMNLLMLGGTDDAGMEAVMSPVEVAAAVAAAVTPGATSSPSTGSRHGAAAWIPNTTSSPHVLGGLLSESSATEILAAASLRASQEPIGSTVCKVRELLGMDRPSSQEEGIPELDSEELWRATAADADKLFLQYGTNELHNGTAEVFPATSTAAAVAAAVAVPRDPSVPPSPAETPAETQAAERRAALETAIPNPLPLSQQGVPTARSPAPDASGALNPTLGGRDSWSASELAAAIGASHYDILETDDGFLSDVLAAEAAAAAAAVVCAAGSSLAAGTILPENVHPLDAAGNMSSSPARRMLLPSSSSSSFVFDATLAMEANMISRQLAGGAPSLRVHGGGEDAILECDELSSTTATPQSVAPAATTTAMPSPECGVAENLYAAMDGAREAVYQDEIASPGPLVTTGDSDREDEDTAAECYRTDALMEGSEESGPARMTPSAAANLNATAPRTAAVVDMDLAFEGTSQDEADLGSVMAAADALQAADEALNAATATEVVDAVMGMEEEQSAVMAGDEAAAAAALESTVTVSPFAVAVPEAAAAIVGTPEKAVGMAVNAAEAWRELQETAAVAAPGAAEDVDMASTDSDAPQATLYPEDVELLDDGEPEVATSRATTEDKPVFLETGLAPDANQAMQHAAAAAAGSVAAAAITTAGTVTVPAAESAKVSAHPCAAAAAAVVKVGCDGPQEEVDSEMEAPAVAVVAVASTAGGPTDALRGTQLSSLPGLPVVAAAATVAEGPQGRTANVLEPVEDSRYSQPLLAGAVASETMAVDETAQGRKPQRVDGTPAVISDHSGAEMATDLSGGNRPLLAATATRTLPLVSTTAAATAAARGEVEAEELQAGPDTPMDNASEVEEVVIPADAVQPTTAVTVLEAGPMEEAQVDGAEAPVEDAAAAVVAIQSAAPVDAQPLLTAAGAELRVEKEVFVDGCYSGMEEPVTAVAEGGVWPLLEAVMEGAAAPAEELQESQGVSMDIAEEPEPATIEPRATQPVADSVEVALEEIRAADLAQAVVVDAVARAFPVDVLGTAPDSHGMAAATTVAAAPSDFPLDVHGVDAVAEDEQPNDTAADVARSIPTPIVGSAKVSSNGFSVSAETEVVSAIADSEGEGVRADNDRRFTDAELHTGSGGELDDQMYDAEEDGFEVGQMQAAFQEQLPRYPEFFTVPEHLSPNGSAAATTLLTEAMPMATVEPETDPSASARMDHRVEGRSPLCMATETEAGTPDLEASTGGMIDIPFDRSTRITLSTVNSHQLDDVDYDIDEDAEMGTANKRSDGSDGDEDGVSADLRHKAPAGAGASLLAAAAASGAGTGGCAVQHTAGDGGVADSNADDGATTATARKRARLAPVSPAAEEEVTCSGDGSGLGLAGFYGSAALADMAREAEAVSGSVAGKASAYMQLDVANLIGAQAASVPMAGAEKYLVERTDRGGPQTESSLDRSLQLVSTTQGTCAIPGSDADEVYNAASRTSTLSSAEAATMAEVSPTKQDACGEAVPGVAMPATSEAELGGGMHEVGVYASRPELVTATPASTWLAPQGAAIAMCQPLSAGTSRISIGVTDEAVLQTPAVISSRTASLPISPRSGGWRSAGPAVQTVPEASSSSEQQPLLHAWQLLVPTSPGSGHEGEGEGGPNSKGSLTVRRSLRSMLSGSSRLSRVSSHRDEEPATEKSKETDTGDDGASTPGMVSPATCIAANADAIDAPGHAANGAATVHGGDVDQQPLGAGPGQVAYCIVKAPHTGADGPMDVDAVVPAQHEAVGVDMSQGVSASPPKSMGSEPVPHGEEVEEELTPAWKVAAAAAVADAGADTNSIAAAACSSLGVRRSLRSMQVASTGSRLERSSSHSTHSHSAAASLDAPFYGDLAATPSCVGEPLPGAAPSASIQTSGSCTSPASGVVLPAVEYGSGDEKQVSPAWKVIPMPSSAGDSPNVATAARCVSLGSQPSFRSSRAGSSRLRRASAPDGEDLHFADMAGDKGAVGDDAEVAAVEQEDPRDSAAAETVLTAAISGGPILTGDVIETGPVLSLGRPRFPTCQGGNASDGGVVSRVQQAAGSSHSADGWTQPPLLRGGSGGRVGSLTNGHSLRHADVGGGGAGSPTRAGTSENGSMAAAWVARLSSRRLNSEAVGSVPLPRRSNSGGDPHVDAMRPAWQVLPLPMSPGSPSGSIDGTSTGYFSASGGAGITSPGAAPSAANILASMRSNSRLSRMSSGIPEDLLAELRLQAHAAVGHLQGSAHDEDSGGGWADMNSSMEQSATHEHLPLGTVVPTAGGQAAAPTAAGDGAGGTLHAWKVLPLRATAPTSSGPVLGDGHGAQAAGAVPITAPRVLGGGRAIMPTSRTGSHSSRLAVASTKPTIPQVSFEPTSPSASSPKAEALPEVSEEEEVETSAVSTPAGVSTPSANAKVTTAAAGDGENSSAVLHAWKLVPPSTNVSASASASTASPGVGMAAATAGLATVHEGNSDAAAFTIVTPQRSHPTLGSRPSLKSLGSVRGSRLSRTSLGVEDYVDESYTDTPAAAGPGDSDDVESDDSAIESAGITEPRQHSADHIAPANEANQNAIAAAAAAAAAAVAVVDNAGDSVLLHDSAAAAVEPPQLLPRSASERSSGPAAIGGMPQGVLDAADVLDSRPGSGALKFVSSRSTSNPRTGDFPHDDDMAFDEGLPFTDSPIARALNSRPSMRSSRSSNSSRLSRVSSARDGGAALLADIREEDGEGCTQSLGGASDVVGASAGVHHEILAREERLPRTEPLIGSQAVLSAAEYDVDDVGGADADSPSGLELPGSRLSPTGGAAMRSARSGSSRLNHMTSQISEAGLEDIKEEG
ncbi:hypothetical protein Vafri_12725, partial [Volvox africanus]